MSRKARNWLLIGVVLIFIIGLKATTARVPAPTEYFDLPQPMVIAHQGGNLLRPGNTMAAFALAVKLGVDVLEMDLHSTRDGKLVLMHDATVDRTTNGSGRIRDLSLVELKTLDAGYRWPFRGESRPWRDKGITVPRLEEVLARFPDMRFNIEIKQAEPDIAVPLCRVLTDYGVESRTLVASFDEDAMASFRAACPTVATSASEPEALWFVIYQRLGLIGLLDSAAHALQLPMASRGFDLTGPALYRAARRHGLHVDTWTVNDEPSMRRLVSAGVGGIITDRPDLLLRTLGRWRDAL